MAEGYKCYYCKKPIDEKDLVEKRIPLKTKSGIRMYRRKLHLDCVEKVVQDMTFERENKIEEMDWRKCYDKFRELLGYDTSVSLSNHAVMRIKGLRVGKYKPNGTNTTSLKGGYEYDVIHKTILFCSANIRHAIANMTFKDENHKVDYCMKIITNNIDFINSKNETKKRVEKIMVETREDVTPVRQAEYQRKGKIVDTSRVDELIKQELEEEKDDEFNFDDMFN